MAVKVWTAGEFTEAARNHARREFNDDEGFNNYFGAIVDLAKRVHRRDDGIAVYVNNDLGHPDIGQWQVVSYGSSAAQLETYALEGAYPDIQLNHQHGKNTLPLTLPDIGGRINWRYSLEAICPSFEQQVEAAELVTYRVFRFYRDERAREAGETGLSLAEAQEHCERDDTHGDGWFDGFEIEV